METPTLLGIGVLALILAMAVVGTILKRKAVAKGNEIGARRSAGRQAGKAGTLGESVVINAPVDVVAGLVAPILTGTWVTQKSPTEWTQKMYHDDDITYRIAPVADGSEVYVAETIEFMGTVNGSKQWRRFRDRIATAAAENGLVSRAGQRHLVRSHAVKNDDHVWIAQ
ncbi:hypothetical protein [Occultella kanbiaonis]|uniref:hypothetical protein n=1 Tax=Occultella kanbiaonis TaxID=2675754 RepID=UPI0013D2A7A9|nr:hypothetical protein [Occultella kanbiaonis]